jgi:hypothetical protein
MRSEGPPPAVPGSGCGRKGDMQTADEESDHLYQDGGVTHSPRQNAHLLDGDHEHRDSSQSQFAAACHQDPTDASQRSTTDGKLTRTTISLYVAPACLSDISPDVALQRHALDAGDNEYPKPSALLVFFCPIPFGARRFWQEKYRQVTSLPRPSLCFTSCLTTGV